MQQKCPYGQDTICILGNRYRQDGDDLWLLGMCDSCEKAAPQMKDNLMNDDITSDILKIVQAQVNDAHTGDPPTAESTSCLCDDLELDDLDRVEIICALEERFMVALDDDDDRRCITVSDLEQLVRSALRDKQLRVGTEC